MAAPSVAVVGMAALRRDLNRMAEDEKGPLYAGIKAAGRAAADPVAARTRARLPTGARTNGRLQGNVRVSATRTGAAVRMGSVGVPYAGWIEFGGTRPQGPSDRSARQFDPRGRYLFPAASALRETSAAAYSAALSKVFASDSVWTNTTANGGSVHD